jgi:hypothetical protein
MRLLVCGGRNHTDRTGVWAVLTLAQPIVLMHGGAAGADTFAREWWEAQSDAWRMDRDMLVFPYDRRLGRAGGPVRNQMMLDVGRPDCVIAFKGGAGTADMVKRALKASVAVYEPFRRGGMVYLRRKPGESNTTP